MKTIAALAAVLLIGASAASAQSTSTGKADDNYGSNAASGNNASNASAQPGTSHAAGAKKKATLNRHAANQPAPGNSAAETAGAATPNDTSRPEAAGKTGR